MSGNDCNANGQIASDIGQSKNGILIKSLIIIVLDVGIILPVRAG